MEGLATTTLAGLQIMIITDFVDETFLRATLESFIPIPVNSDLKWERVSL